MRANNGANPRSFVVFAALCAAMFMAHSSSLLLLLLHGEEARPSWWPDHDAMPGYRSVQRDAALWRACAVDDDAAFAQARARKQAQLQALIARAQPHKSAMPLLALKIQCGNHPTVACNSSDMYDFVTREHVKLYNALMRHQHSGSRARMCGDLFLLNIAAPDVCVANFSGYNVNVAPLPGSDRLVWSERRHPLRVRPGESHYTAQRMTHFTFAPFASVVVESLAAQHALLARAIHLDRPAVSCPPYEWKTLGRQRPLGLAIVDTRAIATRDGAHLCFLGLWRRFHHRWSFACGPTLTSNWTLADFAPLFFPSATLRVWRRREDVPPSAHASAVDQYLMPGDPTPYFYYPEDTWLVKNFMPVSAAYDAASRTYEVVLIDMKPKQVLALSRAPGELPAVRLLHNLTGCDFLPARDFHGSSSVHRVPGTDVWLAIAHVNTLLEVPALQRLYSHVVVVLRGAGAFPVACSEVLDDVFVLPARWWGTPVAERGFTFANGFHIVRSVVRGRTAHVRGIVTGGVGDTAGAAALVRVDIKL